MDDSDNGKKPRKRRVEWSGPDVEYLIDLWEESNELKKTKQYKKLYENIHQQLKEIRLHRSIEEIRTKICNLIKMYRKQCRISYVTGKPSEWIYFDRVKKIVESEDPLSQRTRYDNNLDVSTSAPGESQDSSNFNCVFEEYIESKPSPNNSLCPEPNISMPSAKKRKIENDDSHSIYEKLLNEIKRSNKAVEDELKRSNVLAERSIDIQREILQIFQSTQNN